MRDNFNITTVELHKILGISETSVENNMSFLKENGYIERVGSKKQDIGRYYKDFVAKCKAKKRIIKGYVSIIITNKEF